MSEIRRPRLLDSTLHEVQRLNPSKASITVNLHPLSSASMTIGEDAPDIRIHDYIEMFGPDGSAGIFRVSAIRETCGSQRQVTMEHGIARLGDDMTASDTVLTGTVRDMLSQLLSFQRVVWWALGEVEVNEALPDMDAANANVLETLLSVASSIDGAMLELDQSSAPWLIHLRKKPTDVGCECRLNRNLSGVNIAINDAELCTRCVVEQMDENGEITTTSYDADTIGQWGVVSRLITVEDGKDPEEEARKYLEAHKHPTVSIELDALTLSEQTGEPFDSFRLGLVCRVALPEWGVILEETIVSANYPDVYGQPDQVRLTLSNGQRDAATQLSGLRNMTESNTRSIHKNSQGIAQNLKYYKELDERAIIMAEQIELRATKDELGQYLNEVWIELNAHDASITLNAQHIDKNTNAITAAGERIDGINAKLTEYAGIVDNQGDLLSGVRVELDGIAETLTQQAGKFDDLGELIEGAEIRMDGLEATISLKVSKDGLISAINMSTEQIQISSSKINLEGYVTASEFEAEIARLDLIVGGGGSIDTLNVHSLSATNLYATQSFYAYNKSVAWKDATVLTGGSINIKLDVGVGRLYAYLTSTIDSRSQFSYVNSVSVESATFSKTTTELSYLGADGE